MKINRNALLAVLSTVIICLIQDTSSTLCFQCNSHINPSCGDPFRSHFFYRNIVNCTEEAEKRFLDITNTTTFCRKSKQHVNEEVRVIRDCGFYRGRENDQDMCVRRSASDNVKLLYCACDGDFCNGSRSLTSQGFWMTIFAVLSVRLLSVF